MFFSDVPYPAYDIEAHRFRVYQGSVYVLTHECDIDQDNERPFNDLAVVCPVMRLEDLVEEYKAAGHEDKLYNLVQDIALDRIQRVFYLPPPHDLFEVEMLRGGAILYLNNLVSTHVSLLPPTAAQCALSEGALRQLDAKLQNHLFRPKSDSLPQLA